MARAEDNVQSDLGGGLLWHAKGHAQRWRYRERGAGTGVDDADVAALPMSGTAEPLAYRVAFRGRRGRSTRSMNDDSVSGTKAASWVRRR